MGVALHSHELGDLHAANLADAPQVITSQVDEHHVFGPLLLTRPQFLFHALIGRLITATPPGARDRPVAEMASLHGHENLRRRPQDSEGRWKSEKVQLQ